jgi:hypothetical protein
MLLSLNPPAADRSGGVCGSARQPDGSGGWLDAQETDEQAGCDPSCGTQDSNGPEILLGVFHLAEGEGICERHGRHVAERVDQQDEIHGYERRLRGGDPQQNAAYAVKGKQEALGGEPFVGHQAHQEWGKDGA